MKNYRKLLAGSLALFLAVGITGCSNTSGGGTGVANEDGLVVLNVASTNQPVSFDPADANLVVNEYTEYDCYDTLLDFNQDGTDVVPALAESWEQVDDLTYTYKIREGVKFSDGSDLTMDDVLYSLNRVREDAYGMSYLFEHVDSFEVDEKTRTLTVHLTQPDSTWKYVPATTPCQILKKSVVEAEGDAYGTNEGSVVGTGPYKFVSRSLQENVVLKKFDAYWGEPAHIEDVALKVIADGDSIVMNLEGGSIDMMARLTTTQAAQLGDQFDILEGTMNLVQAMYLNNAVKPFNNEKVRQALSYAINKQEILDFTADGKGTPIASSMFPAFGKYYMEELNDVYTTDVEKAKELLTEAGYPDGFTFTIKVPSNYQPHIDTATVLAEQLKTIGVTANIELIEWESWLSDVYKNREFEATVVGVDASTLTAGALLGRFVSTAHNNFINYSDADYDAAYANAQAAASDEEATKYYKECETILTNTAANVYIQDMAELVALNKKYAGYEFYPLYIQDIAKLYIAE